MGSDQPSTRQCTERRGLTSLLVREELRFPGTWILGLQLTDLSL